MMSGTPMISDVPMSPETDDLCYLSTTPCQFGNCSACLWAPISWSPYMKDKVLPSTRKLVLKKGKAFAFQACARTTQRRIVSSKLWDPGRVAVHRHQIQEAELHTCTSGADMSTKCQFMCSPYVFKLGMCIAHTQNVD